VQLLVKIAETIQVRTDLNPDILSFNMKRHMTSRITCQYTRRWELDNRDDSTTVVDLQVDCDAYSIDRTQALLVTQRSRRRGREVKYLCGL